ncbi:nuclear transport factor 2 family protein [Paenibacillus shenyangensis]|uniref:nuclear transport factor 2 family protein n=1 Tax=Paenibacillus sp. A9 TaxID=1284352 RepID=UPI000365E018|nr:nuclear transport factor 2 family protein [Paenibacillus sp. A9]
MNKKSTRWIGAAVAAAITVTTAGLPATANAASSVCPPVPVSQTGTSAKASVSQQTKNKQLVMNMYQDVFNQHKLNKISSYIAKDYIQHNPLAGDGRQAFADFFGAYIKQNPHLKADVKRIIAQGDLVLVHNHVTTSKQDKGMAVVDIFRIKNNKIVEHWDAGQAVPEKSANDNTMFPLPGTPVQVQPVSSQQVAANKKLVTTFYNQFFNEHDGTALQKYVAEDYIQHNPTVPTGRKPLEAFIPMLQSNPDSRNKIIRVIAEGDIVALHVHAQSSKTDRGSAVVDIFRVANGKIVEHWDVVQPVPEKSVNTNTMF